MDRFLWRRAMRASSVMRPLGSQPLYVRQHQFIRHMSRLPAIAQPSLWKSIIPKPFRRSEESAGREVGGKPKSKEWNPATFYIVMFLFIGSMSIQMIALKREFDMFMRRSEVRIELLREVVEKLQKGEEVDVEKTLGTGDAEKEMGWEEALREIERDDILRNAKRTEKAKPPPPAPAPTPAKTEARGVATPENMEQQKKSKNEGYSNFF
ncbi:hypothetical protein AAE478_003000 [Parahypoxylon ruwenzoriense]